MSGNFPFGTRKNIKHLLQELASRDIHSTQTKINQLITRQKTSYRAARQIYTTQAQCHKNRSSKDARDATLIINSGKENFSHQPQLSQGVLFHPKRSNLTPLTKKGATERQRYQKPQLIKRKDMTIDLPSLGSKLQKKISIEERNSQMRKTQCESSELAIIEEQKTPGGKPERKTFFKLSKQKSWAFTNLLKDRQ